MTRDELDLVVVLVRIGRDDRELYRKLRAEAWEMVQENHRRLSAEEREIWLRGAS